MLFTSSLKFIGSAYVSLALQSNVGCFMIDPLILGPKFSVLAVLAVHMVWIATLATSATAGTMYSLEFICLLPSSLLCLTALYAYFEPVFVRPPCFLICWDCLVLSLPNTLCFSLALWKFLLLTPCSVSCLRRDNTDVCLYVSLLLCVNSFHIHKYIIYMCAYI